MDLDRFLFVPIYNLQDLLDVINVLYSLFELLQNNSFFHYSLDFLDLCNRGVDLDNLIFFFFDLLHSLKYERNFYNFLNNILNILFDPNKLRYKCLNLHYLWHFDNFLYTLLHFINLWYLDSLFNNLLDNFFSRYNLLYRCNNWYWFFSDYFNLFNLILNYDSLMWDFYNLSVDNYFFYYLVNFSNFYFRYSDLNNLLNNLRHLLDDVSGHIHFNQLLNNFLNRVFYLYRNHLGSLYFYHMFSFHNVCNYLLNLNLPRNLYHLFDDSLTYNFNSLYLFFIFGNLHYLIHNSINYLLNLNVHVFLNLYLHNLLLKYWNLYYFLYLSYYLLNYYFLDRNLYNLWNLNYFLYNSWYDNHLLHYFLHFYYLWNLNHFLNYFVDVHPNFLDHFDMLWNFYYFFLEVFHNSRNINIVGNWFFNFENCLFFYDQRLSDHYFLNNCVLHFLNDGFSDYLRNNNNFLVNDGDLNSFFNYFLYLLFDCDNMRNLLFHFFDPLLDNYVIFENLDLSDLLFNCSNLYNFFYHLNNLDDLFFFLNNRNWFLHYPLYNFVLDLDIRNHLFLHLVFHSINYFLNNLLYFYYLGNLYHSLNNFLDESWNLYNFLYYFFYINYLLHLDSNLFNFRYKVINLLFYFNNFLDLYKLLDNDFNFNNLWYFFCDLYDSVCNCWNFNDFFNYSFNRNYLLHNIIDHSW